MNIVIDEEILAQVSEPVLDYTEAMRDFICDLAEKMKNTKGIGLSAIQVGYPIRIFVMETRLDGTLAIINPEIISGEKKEKRKEGCLSFVGTYINVTRWKRIAVKYNDKEGNLIERKFNGIEARIFQHELDHLNGITMLDRARK